MPGTVVKNESLVAKALKSNYQLWHELCNLISQNSEKVPLINNSGAALLLADHLLHLRSLGGGAGEV